MKHTPGEGLYTINLASGCRQCIRGTKLVLFVTGVCDMGCFYCPVSFMRANRDVVYANERLVTSDTDIIEEAERMRALGTGITGGDPLVVPERTARYIALLKDHFGEKHHIHLYTGRPNIRALKLLKEAGLDELRVHPPEQIWSRFRGTAFEKMIAVAAEMGLKVGLEIPALPGMEGEICALVRDSYPAGASFLNMNELEISETNADALRERGYRTVSDSCNAVEGSAETAMAVVRAGLPVPVHFCPSRFKDSVQLRERIKRTARNVHWSGEIVTDEGTLLKGVIEDGNIQRIYEELSERYSIPEKYMRLDSRRGRIEIAPWIIEEIASAIGGRCYIVEEYPTADRIEVERSEIRPR